MEHKSSRTIQKICRFGHFIIGLALILFIIMTILIAIIGIVAFTDMVCMPSGMTQDKLIYKFFTGLASCAILIVVFYLLHELTENLSKGSTPFTEENVCLLMNVAKVLLVGFLVTVVLQVVLFSCLKSPGESLNFDFSSLVIAVVVYLFALIFQYGLELQEESDSFL